MARYGRVFAQADAETGLIPTVDVSNLLTIRQPLRRVASEANQQLRATEAVKLVKEIDKFQKGAEFGFFTFPLTYYGTHTIEFIVPKLMGNPQIKTAVAAGLFAGGFVFAAREDIPKLFRACNREISKQQKAFSAWTNDEKKYLQFCFELTKEQLKGVIKCASKPLQKKRNKKKPQTTEPR